MNAILQLKKELERVIQSEVLELKAAQARLVERISGLETEFYAWQDRYNEVGLQKDSSYEVLMIAPYLAHLEKARQSLMQELHALAEKIAAALARLEVAYRERKQVELLRDKQKAAYIVERDSQEQKRVNEMSVLRFAREMRTE